MVLERHGWRLLYHPIFGDHYIKLRARVRALKAELPEEQFKAHPDAKVVAAVKRAITDTVPQDPNRPDFWLRANLAKFRRLKGYGLPARHRLFYVFSSTAKTIIYLYLNDSATLRKEGATTDPYEIFAGLVASGQIGQDFEANYARWRRAHGEQVDGTTT